MVFVRTTAIFRLRISEETPFNYLTLVSLQRCSWFYLTLTHLGMRARRVSRDGHRIVLPLLLAHQISELVGSTRALFFLLLANLNVVRHNLRISRRVFPETNLLFHLAFLPAPRRCERGSWRLALALQSDSAQCLPDVCLRLDGDSADLAPSISVDEPVSRETERLWRDCAHRCHMVMAASTFFLVTAYLDNSIQSMILPLQLLWFNCLLRVCVCFTCFYILYIVFLFLI